MISEYEINENQKKSHEPRETSYNAVKLIFKENKPNETVKEEIKRRFGAHWNDEDKNKFYTAPIKNQIFLESFLAGNEIECFLEPTFDSYHDLPPNKQKAHRLEQARQMTVDDFFEQKEELNELLNDYNKRWDGILALKQLEKVNRDALLQNITKEKQIIHLNLLFEEYDDAFIENEAIEFEKWMQQPGSLYFKEFAFERGYSPQRLSEFAESNKRFSEVYATAKQWQECRLVRGGLLNEFNAGFCKFVMGNVCNWSDKSESKVSGDSSSPLGFILQNVNCTKDLVKDE